MLGRWHGLEWHAVMTGHFGRDVSRRTCLVLHTPKEWEHEGGDKTIDQRAEEARLGRSREQHHDESRKGVVGTITYLEYQLR
jgi:hypothetical protein